MEKTDKIQQEDPKKRELLISEGMNKYLNNIEIGKLYWEVDEKKIIPQKLLNAFIVNLKDNIKKGKGVILSGGLGVGKTTILCWIAKEVFKNGKSSGYLVSDGNYVPTSWSPLCNIRFISVSRLFSLIYNKDIDDLENYERCKLLLLDDFGREYGHDFPVSIFEDFIEYRYSNMLSTIVTTNLTKEQLKGLTKYARVVDRWRDKKLYTFIEIAGDSQR